VTLAVAALALSSCGNSSDEPAKEPAGKTHAAARTPSMQEFAAATAKICRRANHRVDGFLPLGTDPATRHSSRLAIIEILRGQIDDTVAVGYPPGSRRELEPVTRAGYRLVGRLEKDESLDLQREIGKTYAPYAAVLHKYAPGCD
jgi:hypothetical protein